MRPTGHPLLILPVKCRERHPETLRFAADFILRNQAVVLIEGGVLHCLRHYRAGVLLKFHCKGAYCIFVCIALALDLSRQQHVPHKIEDTGVRRVAALFRYPHRPIHITGVVGGAFAAKDISTVNRKACHDLGQRTALAVEGKSQVRRSPLAMRASCVASTCSSPERALSMVRCLFARTMASKSGCARIKL